MGSYLNPGNLSFRGSLRSKIYVDKSELIAKTNEALCTEQKYICVSRPRRFGKSMAANMLAAYYDRSESTEELFQNLTISKERSYKENLNQYDVIKINMQEFLSMSETMEEMLEMLKNYLVLDFKETFHEVQFRDEKNLIQVMKEELLYRVAILWFAKISNKPFCLLMHTVMHGSYCVLLHDLDLIPASPGTILLPAIHHFRKIHPDFFHR